MKISQFIIATEQDDNPNTYLLYNTHTTAFVAMEKEKYKHRCTRGTNKIK